MTCSPTATRPGDMCFYPRSSKLRIRGVVFKAEQRYWDGE